MKLPRWLVIVMLSSSILAVLAAAGWWWVTWPRRTADKFLSALAEGRTDEAIAMIALANWQRYSFIEARIRVDAQMEIIIANWRNASVEPQSRSVYDVLSRRQSFRIPRYMITVERNRVLDDCSRYEDLGETETAP